MKVNASAIFGNYSNTVEMEYDAENKNECEQADHFVGVLFGVPKDFDCILQNKSAEEIAKELERMAEKIYNQQNDVIKE